MRKIPVILLMCCFVGVCFSQENEETGELFHKCKYAKSESVKKVIEQLMSPIGKVASIDFLNAIVVHDSKNSIELMQKYIDKMDVYIPQVFVDARIVEITVDTDAEYEISHILTSYADGSAMKSNSSITTTVPGANPNTGKGLNLILQAYKDFAKLDESLRWLVTAGKAKILSTPSLIVDFESEGNIITGEQIPVLSSQIVGGAISTTTQFKNIGIRLKVVPQQITEDSVRLLVNPEVSNVTGYTTGAGGVTSPIIAIRSTDTVVTVKDGEVISIGGLMRNEERRVESKVPILGDIPILGILFKSERNQTVKTQLMFFLKINIIKEGQKDTGRIFEPSGDEKIINDQIKKIEENIR